MKKNKNCKKAYDYLFSPNQRCVLRKKGKAYFFPFCCCSASACAWFLLGILTFLFTIYLIAFLITPPCPGEPALFYGQKEPAIYSMKEVDADKY